MTKYGFRKKAYRACAPILVSALLLASGCRSAVSDSSSGADDPETVTSVSSEAESVTLPESSEETETTEEKTESVPDETSAEEVPETSSEPVDDQDFLKAYRQYYQLLRENGSKDGDPGAGIRRVALCDICGNGLPELLYRTDTGFTIISSGEEQASEIFSLPLPSETEEAADWCFFTIADDRRLYEYSCDPDDIRRKHWYYYEPFSDGSISRTELLMQQQSEGEDLLYGGIYFYMGAECTVESGQEVVRSLLSGMENILLYSSDRLRENGFFSASASAEDYGMSAERTEDFLRSEIRRLGGVEGFQVELTYFIEGQEYLESGENYDTGEGAAEIRIGLHDLNGDGTPELLITNGSAALSGRTAHVYEPENGSFGYLGDAGFRDCLFYTAPGTDYPGVFCTGGDSGFIMDIYYELQEDGTIRSEMVASYEDTSYKVESHDEQRVTPDTGLYEAWLAARPTAERPGTFVRMLSREEILEQGAQALQNETGESEE